MATCIGLMSGTSLDGVDGVLTAFDGSLHAAHVPFLDDFRRTLLALQAPTDNEIHTEALAANELARHYAACVDALLDAAGLAAADIAAIGAHGQTIRHLPDQGLTRQINNPALLAELTGIAVVADFRSRDIAAGGQGAPLVPAFHQSAFGSPAAMRVVANIGGIANISVLRPDGTVLGYDTGPGNVLMDSWANTHLGKAFDANGNWAASGSVIPALLDALLGEPYLSQAAPKSTGRDLFNRRWLEHRLQPFERAAAADVQATLAAFTARSLADAIRRDAPQAEAVYVCGGGALNGHLMAELRALLNKPVADTGALGVAPLHVEALAFAWLAARFLDRLPGNLPSVTGAKGPRVLGALYPA
ncbi:MAG: anhydro-N-acetylmuramic acid kinase [Burkholderiaceae bacterium]|nr:anhydro-N-acetylmuramic acid kinase [Burkholderiaceae bacterium]